MASSEMISSEFADQARDCWTDFRSWKALAGCEHVFATSVANMMGLLIVRPTQADVDRIAAQCEHRCVERVAVDLQRRLGRDEACDKSIYSDVQPLLWDLGKFSCAKTVHEKKSIHCAGNVAQRPRRVQVLYDHSVAEGLFSLEQTFAWPPAERMPAMCRELQGLGCCAFSFQRMLTAFLFATCRIDAAVVASSLTSACEAAGHPLEQLACPSLPGALADEESWLSQYEPYVAGVTTQRELECRDKSSNLSDLVAWSGCWQTPCQLAMSTLGFQRERTDVHVNVRVYLVSIASSFTVLCFLVIFSCMGSWVVHTVQTIKLRKMSAISAVSSESITRSSPGEAAACDEQ